MTRCYDETTNRCFLIDAKLQIWADSAEAAVDSAVQFADEQHRSSDGETIIIDTPPIVRDVTEEVE